MPVQNFAETAESKPSYDKYGAWAGGVLAGAFIGMGIALPAVEAKDVVRETGESAACTIRIIDDCGEYVLEEVGDVFEDAIRGGFLIGLGGLVAVIAGAKPLENRAEEQGN
jgi:formate/nitrite transporter FocA (FNT family)